jgi:non-ribosomal peptide synthetase component E (peptide arylation enzyme)
VAVALSKRCGEDTQQTQALVRRYPSVRSNANSAKDPSAHADRYNSTMTTLCNIAARLPELARERPDQIAMRCPGRDGGYSIALTYAQLDARSDAIAAGLATRGPRRNFSC